MTVPIIYRYGKLIQTVQPQQEDFIVHSQQEDFRNVKNYIYLRQDNRCDGTHHLSLREQSFSIHPF